MSPCTRATCCPRCGGADLAPHGYGRHGERRRRCRACGRYVNEPSVAPGFRPCRCGRGFAAHTAADAAALAGVSLSTMHRLIQERGIGQKIRRRWHVRQAEIDAIRAERAARLDRPTRRRLHYLKYRDRYLVRMREYYAEYRDTILAKQRLARQRRKEAAV